MQLYVHPIWSSNKGIFMDSMCLVYKRGYHVPMCYPITFTPSYTIGSWWGVGRRQPQNGDHDASTKHVPPASGSPPLQGSQWKVCVNCHPCLGNLSAGLWRNLLNDITASYWIELYLSNLFWKLAISISATQLLSQTQECTQTSSSFETRRMVIESAHAVYLSNSYMSNVHMK